MNAPSGNCIGVVAELVGDACGGIVRTVGVSYTLGTVIGVVLTLDSTTMGVGSTTRGVGSATLDVTLTLALTTGGAVTLGSASADGNSSLGFDLNVSARRDSAAAVESEVGSATSLFVGLGELIWIPPVGVGSRVVGVGVGRLRTATWGNSDVEGRGMAG